MRIRLTMPAKDGKRLKEEILQGVEKVEEDEWSEEWELVSIACFPISDYPSIETSVAEHFLHL